MKWFVFFALFPVSGWAEGNTAKLQVEVDFGKNAKLTGHPVILMIMPKGKSFAYSVKANGEKIDKEDQPRAISLGDPAESIKKAIMVPAGSFSAYVFVKRSNLSCDVNGHDFISDTSCIPFKGDLVCSTAEFESGKTEKINFSCATLSEGGSKS